MTYLYADGRDPGEKEELRMQKMGERTTRQVPWVGKNDGIQDIPQGSFS